MCIVSEVQIWHYRKSKTVAHARDTSRFFKPQKITDDLAKPLVHPITKET